MAISGSIERQGEAPARTIDFTQPAGEPALMGPDSVSWRVFKNPLAMYIGGITAVLLEFAEPRVRTGVWEHTSFRRDPLPRLKRTGLAAMVTVYGAQSVAERMIAGVTSMHARVNGTTPDGQPYRALDPELMDWVQATASFGFLQAYHHYVTPLSAEQRDQFYREALPAARLYGASGAPACEEDQQRLFERMYPQMERHAIVSEFLDVMQSTRVTGGLKRPLAKLGMRAAIDILPEEVRSLLDLPNHRPLRSWQHTALRFVGGLADRITVHSAPPAQACVRLGLPEDYLYRRR